ncbi:MAG: magnesium/cobalt transporter CorA [Candidatus Omnitrophica bacterium]|nr:magnesium/cobalt transporter CorA [Candidatus Omnitrophota bacterium]
MSKFIKKVSKKVGLHPGALVAIDEPKHQKVKITAIQYDKDNFQEKQIQTIEESLSCKKENAVLWLNINSVSNVDVIKDIAQFYKIHPLVLEDIMSTGHRPKMEQHGEYVLVILKMLYCSGKKKEILSEQISLILGPNYVLSLQEVEGDVFDAVRDRIRKGVGQVRNLGADYLLHILMDAIVDNYFVVLEKLGDRIEILEEQIITDVKPQVATEVHLLKREIIYLRKQIWPMREVLSGLQRGDSKVISRSVDIYLRDVYDHIIQIMDTIESFRDILAGMHDIYLSTMSNRMNEVMKVLTIFASIFIPLTFIAGVYGMNFKYMPELDSHIGYFVVWGIMIIVAGTMVIYFRRKRWL